MKRWILLALAMAPAAAAQQAPAPARIVGRVVDQENHRPISGAAITVEGENRAISDEQGWFTLSGVPAGRVEMRVEMLGYAERADSLELRPGQSYDVEITLARQAIALAPIDVSIRSEFLEARGFYERERSGGGTFIGRPAIERRLSRQLTDFLREVPGVRIHDLEPGKRHVRINRGATTDAPAFGGRTASVLPGCEPDLYIDGQLFRERIPRDPTEQKVTAWDVVPTEQIEGVEVYTGPNAPLQWQSPCGVVLVWTRRAPSSSMTTVVTRRAAPPPSLTPGSRVRLTPRFGAAAQIGLLQSVGADSISLQLGNAVRNFAVTEVRRLEIDRGLAPVLERSWRGAKWGFFVSAAVIAITAAGEEFSRSNDRHASVSSTSPRNPAFAASVIGGTTVVGALLGSTLWRYRKWEEISIR